METETTDHDAMYHFIFSELLRSQGYTSALAEAARQKAHFDDKTHPVEFNTGDLVQVYNSKMDVTYETKAKLLPRWSPPRIITDCLLNSYTLCRSDGTELKGTTHTWHLRRYIPQREGPISHTHLTDVPIPETQQWDESEDEAVIEIQGLF